MECLFGRYRWSHVHGLAPSAEFVKALSKRTDVVLDRARQQIWLERAGPTAQVPSLEDLGGYLTRAENHDAQAADMHRRAYWYGAALGQLDTAAQVAQLLPPRGTIRDLPAALAEECRGKAVLLSADAMLQAQAGEREEAVLRSLSRLADDFIHQLKGRLDAARVRAST